MKLTRVIAISITLLLVFTMAALAAPLNGATTKTLSTNYTLVNLGPTMATVNANYLKSDGTPWTVSPANQNFTIPENFGQAILAQYLDPAMDPGQGSVVISSDQPLGAVVQIQARSPQTPTSGAYSGVTKPSQTYYAPQVFSKLPTSNGLSNSQIAIQNTNAGAITATVQFVPFPGITGLSTYTNSNIQIQPGASFLYDLSDETNLTSTNPTVTGWTGSAIISVPAGNTIAAVVNTFAGPNSLQTYNAFPAESVGSVWSIPQFTSKLDNGLSTPVIMQNLSGGDIAIGDVTLDCDAATGFTPATFTQSNTTVIPANATFAFNPVGNSDYPNHWSGTCTVTSATGKDMVGIVQMRRPGVSEELAVYEAIPGESTDTRVVVPLISKNQANGFATAATIKNLSTTSSALVKLTFTPAATYGGSQTPVTFNATIPANGNLILSQRFTGTPEIPDGWYGSLLVEPQDSATAQPLAALVQLTNTLATTGDTFMAHIAITLP